MSKAWVNLKRVTGPGTPAVSVDDLKAFLRVTHAEEDAVISSLGVAATTTLEEWTRRAFVTQAWNVSYGSMETGQTIILPRPAVQEITLVEYVDSEGLVQTFAASNYDTVTGEDGGIQFKELPEISGTAPEPYRVTYTAGFGDAASDVPEPLTTAIKLLVSDWYEKRLAEGAIPEWIKALAGLYRVPMT